MSLNLSPMRSIILRMADIRIHVEILGAPSLPSPPSYYTPFLCGNGKRDAELIFWQLTGSRGKPSHESDPAHRSPILQSALAKERFLQRRENELASIRPHYLEILCPSEQRLEVFLDKKLDHWEKLEGHLFSLAACLIGDKRGLLMHGAGFEIGGVSAIVIGPSGAGKSTFVNLTHPDFLISDDLVAIANVSENPILYSTPLGGATDGQRNVPLNAVFFPRKDVDFSITTLPPMKAFLTYWFEHRHYVYRLFKPYTTKYFENAYSLFQRVPSFEVSFSQDFLDIEQIKYVMRMSQKQP